MRAVQNQTFAFGDFVMVPTERLLLRNGEPIALTAKAFDLLSVLVQRAGHLVTKEELFEEVWPGTFVQETNLTVNISAVRKALGDALLRTEPEPTEDAAPASQPAPRELGARHRSAVRFLTWAVFATVAC